MKVSKLPAADLLYEALKVWNSRWRSKFQNVETSANIANSETKASNKQFKTVLAEKNEKLSIESHENAQNVAYWVCLPSKNEAFINNQYLDVYGTGK